MPEQRRYAPGEYLFHEGDTSTTLYMLMSGEVQVIIKGRILDLESEPGSLLGEMSFLLPKPRGASIRVTKPAEFVVIENPAVLVETQPLILMRMAQGLARRLWNLENRVLDHVTANH